MQAIHRGGDHRAAGVPGRRDAGGDVDPLHQDAAEDRAVRCWSARATRAARSRRARRAACAGRAASRAGGAMRAWPSGYHRPCASNAVTAMPTAPRRSASCIVGGHDRTVAARRSLIALLLGLAAGAARVSRPAAKKFTLPSCWRWRARNPGLQADAAATAAMRGAGRGGQAATGCRRATCCRSWRPRRTWSASTIWGVRARADVHHDHVARRPASARVSWNRVFTRTEVKLIQPIWDFGKISAGIAAAEAGVGVSRAEGGRRARRSRAERAQGLLRPQVGARGARHARRGRRLRRRRAEEASRRISPSGTGNVDGHRQAAPAHGARRARRAHPRGQAAAGDRARQPARAARARRAGRHRRRRRGVRAARGPGAPGHLLRGSGAADAARGADARVRRQGQARARRSRAAQGVPGPRADRRRRSFAYAQTVDNPHERLLQPLLQQHGGGRRGGAAHAARPRAQDRARPPDARRGRARSSYRRSEALGGICSRCARPTAR